ncbi:MAG: hypothetical protein ACREKH_20250 [Candidatus Rokuibacteriota bacterium]
MAEAQPPLIGDLRQAFRAVPDDVKQSLSFARARRRLQSWDVFLHLRESSESPTREERRLRARQAVSSTLAGKIEQVVVLNGAPPRLCSQAVWSRMVWPAKPDRSKDGVRPYRSFLWQTLKSPSPIRRRTLLLSAGIALAALAIVSLNLWLSGVFTETGIGLAAAGVSPSTTVEAYGLRAQAAVERDRLFVDERFLVWLTLQNGGVQTLDRVEVGQLSAEGMEKVGDCWTGSGTPACLSSPLLGQVDEDGARRLEPGERATLWAELKVRRDPGDPDGGRLVARVSWTESREPKAPHSLELAFPRLKIQERRGHLLRSAGSTLRELLKDFALPVAVLLLGFWFERTRKRQELWHQMLERVHENAQHHYMPLSGAIFGLRTEWSRAFPENSVGKLDDETTARLFFYFVLIHARVKRLKDEIGGYYFKNRDGENLIQSALVLFVRRSLRPIVGATDLRKDLDALTSRIDVAETLDCFLERGTPPPETHLVWPFGLIERRRQVERLRDVAKAFAAVREGFSKWLMSHSAEDVRLLELVELALDYEMNVPYQPWYGQPEPLDVDACLGLVRKLVHREHSESPVLFERFAENAHAYLYSRI